MENLISEMGSTWPQAASIYAKLCNKYPDVAHRIPNLAEYSPGLTKSISSTILTRDTPHLSIKGQVSFVRLAVALQYCIQYSVTS